MSEDFYEEEYPGGHRPPAAGGCWICCTDDGRENDEMAFDIEFDCWYHPECLPDYCSSILEYEQTR